MDLNEQIAKAVEVLRAGGIVMHPTETCYGLAVDVHNEDALKKLYRVKQMDEAKPVSILVSGFAMAEEYALFSEKAFDIASNFWPGPLSILLPRKRNLPEFFNPGHEFVSLRNSSDEFCMKLVEEFGGPLTTTSANIAGEPQLYVAEAFSDEIDFVVDGGEIAENMPSTIVKLNGDDLEILRQGGIVIE